MFVFIPKKELVSLDITYYRLDYPSLLQSFFWQVDDVVPEIPRIHRFLNFWREEIRAPIKEIRVSVAAASKYRSATFLKVFH